MFRRNVANSLDMMNVKKKKQQKNASGNEWPNIKYIFKEKFELQMLVLQCYFSNVSQGMSLQNIKIK